MFKLGGPCLHDVDIGDQRQDDIGGEAMLQLRFDSESIGGIDEDTGVLRGDDRLDDGSQIVDVGQCFHAQDDVVIGILP
jgi:hypothetical protein